MNPPEPIHVLVFTTLFPHAGAPSHGIFVENRLLHLVSSAQVHARVLAPVPYFPLNHPAFGAWARHATAPAWECRHGLEVFHPRYLVIPRVGMNLTPWFLFRTGLAAFRRLRALGWQPELIDAHYLYPDGVAATWLGHATGLPVVITARGSDVTQLPQFRIPNRLIRAAIRRADALISVSAALRAKLIALGAPADKVTVLRNGVDTILFRPPPDATARAALRVQLGLDGPTLLSVGHLIERKGHDRVIAALAELPGFRLLIAGEGPERARLEALIGRLGLRDRVHLLGACPHNRLPELYGAADALVLASSREGWANVLLESIACGTPVLASDIPGNPEVIRAPAAGRLFSPNTPRAIAEAARALFAVLPDREATRRYSLDFGWEETTHGQLALFRRVLKQRALVP